MLVLLRLSCLLRGRVGPGVLRGRVGAQACCEVDAASLSAKDSTTFRLRLFAGTCRGSVDLSLTLTPSALCSLLSALCSLLSAVCCRYTMESAEDDSSMPVMVRIFPSFPQWRCSSSPLPATDDDHGGDDDDDDDDDDDGCCC